MTDCIFCQIVAKTSPAHIVWEDADHLAFLSIFPNTNGVTVVIPKAHHESYVFAVPDQVMTDLMLAAKKVARAIDTAFADVGRTGVVFEGFGVNHLHAKLFPLHGTLPADVWQKRTETRQEFFENYQGYISSHDSKRADDQDLAATAALIRAQMASE